MGFVMVVARPLFVLFFLSLSFSAGLGFLFANVSNITLEDYHFVSNLAMLANNFLIRDVLSRPCKIFIDFETETMHFDPPLTPEEEYNFNHYEEIHERETPENKTIHMLGRICLVHQGSDPNKPSFLGLYDTLHYLRLREPWYGFLNRAYYALQNDRTFYIWLGELPDETRPTFEGPRDTVRIPWFQCGKGKQGNHAYKILALSALFDIPNPPQKVLFMDSDMFVPFDSVYRPFYVIEKDFEDPTVFLIGNTGGSESKRTLKLMNSGHLGVKNNDVAKRFLALWWQTQCGLKDQLALHLTLLAYFSSVSEYFSFSVHDLGLYNYNKAKEGGRAYYWVEEKINEIRMGKSCPKSPRLPTVPSEGFTREPAKNRVLMDDPLCGIVTTHVEQNSYCHCHLDLGRKCMGRCKTTIWPPPHKGAPLGTGREPEFNLTWFL